MRANKNSLLTLGQVLTAHARMAPLQIGVRDLDHTLTFSQWNDRCCRLANALISIGLKQGDRVAVLAYNRLEWAEMYGAAAKAGLVLVPVNFRLSGPEVLHILQDSGASAIVAEDLLTDTIDAIRPENDLSDTRYFAIGKTPAGWQAYENLVSHGTDTEPVVLVNADDPWCLMYTSGTTGKPKGAIRDHRGMAMLAMMTAIELGLHKRDNALLVMPLCHANSLNFFTAFAYCGGAVSIYSRASFDPTLCLRSIAENGITFTSLVPTHYHMLLDVPAAERPTLTGKTLEKLMVSSAPAQADTKRAIMEMFPSSGLYELYGSTEAGWVTMLHPHEQFDRIGSVGREVIGSAAIRLLDDAGVEVNDGQPGELYSCSPYSFAGYWNQPEKTAQAYRGNYLTVGDMATRDADGYIHLVDRKKNLIISGGENIYPSEVESILAQHATVRDVAVVGYPDQRWGERVAAVVVLQPGTEPDEAGLMQLSRQYLAGFKCPSTVLFLTESDMPRNATGKILHRKVKEIVASRLLAN